MLYVLFRQVKFFLTITDLSIPGFLEEFHSEVMEFKRIVFQMYGIENFVFRFVVYH